MTEPALPAAPTASSGRGCAAPARRHAAPEHTIRRLSNIPVRSRIVTGNPQREPRPPPSPPDGRAAGENVETTPRAAEGHMTVETTARPNPPAAHRARREGDPREGETANQPPTRARRERRSRHDRATHTIHPHRSPAHVPSVGASPAPPVRPTPGSARLRQGALRSSESAPAR